MVEAIKTKINPNGRIVIPLSMRKALGVKPGDEVLMRLVDGELRIYTTDGALERLRQELRELTGASPARGPAEPSNDPAGGPSRGLVEELVQRRRGGERNSWRA